MNEASSRPARSASPPRRRIALVSVVAAAFILGALAWMVFCVFAPGRPPWDVVLITLDTTRADRLGCYGYPLAETPTMDQFGRQSVRYERCYAPAPMTLPSHCSIFTGLYPARHGIHTNGSKALHDEAETLAEILSRAGYDTAAVVGAFVLDRQFGLAQGFRHYDDSMPKLAQASQFEYAERNARHVTDAALNLLRRRRAKPNFLWVHYFDPHSPYAPPEYDADFASRAAYDAEISFVDSHLKRLLAFFDEERDRATLVILTADHGEGLGQHGELTHGLFAYDGTLRVPLLVRFPDRRAAGTVVAEPVSLVDLLPSVVSWLGLTCAGDLDGERLPLRDHARNKSTSPPRSIYFENRFVEETHGWSALVGIIKGQHKLIRAPRPELYHLADDPAEEHNLFDNSNPQSSRLLRSLVELETRLSSHGPLRGKALALTDEDRANLQALGYTGSHDGSRDDSLGELPNQAPDPKDMVEVYHRIQQATLLLEQGSTAEAASMLIQLLGSDDPGNRRAMLLLASLIPDNVELRPRIVDCLLVSTTVRNRRPPDPFVLGRLGQSLIEEQRIAEANEVLKRLVAIEPSSAEANYLLAEASRHLGRLEEAARCYGRAIELADSLVEQPEWLDEARKQAAILHGSQRTSSSSVATP